MLARLAQVGSARTPRVDFAFVFGSFAEDRPFHDIDVGVRIGDHSHGRPWPSPTMPSLRSKTDWPGPQGFPVDLVVLNGRPVTFLFHVYRGTWLLSGADEARLTSELERTMRTYFDIAPVLRHATREAFGT